ncbi:LuxR C-terminal-related transcriptional regulator [Streptomyces sp. NPDC051907]|uniref:helix-turn-helix transcriptional regulator n=1 Tax=Streptomyces sp. NPDC051907 TaxID=3155284 RepID=UPI00342BC3E0
MNPLRVAILASEPLVAAGIAAYVQASGEIMLLPPDARRQADVCVVLDNDVSEATLARMERAAKETTNPGMRIVLVADSIREHHLARAVGYGLARVVLRREAVRERVVSAVLGIRGDVARTPDALLSRLVEHVRAVQRDVLPQDAATVAGLQARETAVLRLLADGMDTSEIAERLSFSERTIKNVIHGVTNRLELRNRAHAVAYALRSGVL